MRFVVAIVLFAIALTGIALGVAQRTVWKGPATFTSSVETTGDAPVTILAGEALAALPGTQTIAVSGSDDIFFAYGRTSDVEAWVGDAAHNVVGFDAETEQLTSESVGGSESEVPSPAGSDLWLQEFTGAEELTRKISAPADVSVILVADGVEAAPSRITVTWPLDNSTPLSGPLIVGGLLALVAGLLAFLWALLHARRARGPRRRTPTLPKPPRRFQLRGRRRGELEAPKTGEVVLPGDPFGPAGTGPTPTAPPAPTADPGEAAADGAGEAVRDDEAPTRRGRRALGAGSALLLGALLLSGCTSLGEPVEASATDPAVDAAVADLPAVAVTVPQFRHILTEAVETISDADSARDAALAEERLAGPALAERTAFYTAVARDGSIPAPAPIPDDDVRIMVPEQRDSWPRTVFAVVQSDDATDPYFGLVLIQQSPRENYLVHYAVQLEPEADIPGLAPPAIGSPRVAADNKLGVVAPEELADAYGDVLVNGEGSESFDLFDPENDTLRTAIGQASKQEQLAKLPSTARLTFSHQLGEGEVVSFGTVDGGQLVATQLYDIETIRPAEQGAAINPSGTVAALSGKTQTTTGIVATYGVQLLFYLPPGADEGAKVQLLGFSQGLIRATE